MSQIRKEQGKGGNSEADRSGAEVRRSRRDRVPNNKYAESIEEMYRSMTGRDTRLRNDRNPNSQQSSWSHRKREEEEVSRPEGNDWLKCLLTEGDSKTRLIDVEIICGRPPPRRKVSEYSELRRPIRNKSEDQSEVADQVKKMVKKPSESMKSNKAGGLLGMLMEAAEKVAKAPEQVLRQKVRAAKQKAMREEAAQQADIEPQEDEDAEGKIVRVRQYQDKVVFQHSKNGQIQVPMLEQSKDMAAESTDQQSSSVELKALERCFSQYKKKVHTPLILT